MDENNIARSITTMVNNPLFSDIIITFKDEDVKLFAHKLILSAKSKVFNRIFVGPLSTVKETIEIKECRSNEFLEALRYCYTDRIQLSQENVAGVIAVANYYDIHGLELQCCDFAIKGLDLSNVLEVYSANYPFANKLDVKCLSMLDDKMSEIISQDNFMYLLRPCLQTLLARDSIAVNEFDLFEAVHKWITYNSQTNESIYESEILKMIRYPIMTMSEFSQCCKVDSSILTTQDIADIIQYIETGDETPSLSFSIVKRHIYIDADLEFRANVEEEHFYWVDEEERKTMYFHVIIRFDFVSCENSDENCMFDIVHYGIEVCYLNGIRLYKSSSAKPYIDCDEPILLVPNVQYTLASMVTWGHSHDLMHNSIYQEDYCAFKMSEVPVGDDGYGVEEENRGPFCITDYDDGTLTFISKISYKTLK